ncbi:YD repeat-containing protein [Chitinophaga ginsengisoli]|uniref:YD repeat-containing protein n=1 Tax=Chitinophaga ginsengisoli TaxID=363837 RepID=A0A2P8FXI5_9BACT|nr:YD repeat-containing protein [Chitinophaga ginsengisoli]
MQGLLAQTQNNAIAPLPPNAAELFKYNSIPVSPMTGVPDISYPLYEINTGKIKVPIALSYHASGIKVSQRATWVGLGWSLMPGGSISRAVRGITDETDIYGWFNHRASLDTLPLIQSYDVMQAWVQNTPDGQPDFFSYNIPGKSGKFIYSRDSSAFMTFPYQPVVIKRIINNPDATLNNTYEITDDDGTRYCFRQMQKYINDTYNLITYTQSWYLSQIISNDSRDTVFFRYDDPALSGAERNDEITKSFSLTYSKSETENGGRYQKGEIIAADQSIHYGSTMLSEILFRQGKVVFYGKGTRMDGGTSLDSVVIFSKDSGVYSRVKKITFDYGYFYSGTVPTNENAYRLKLLSFNKLDLTGGQPETYKFEYNSIPLPDITSFKVDYWGFYNGVNNTTLMPAIVPDQADLQSFGTLGTANRDPSAYYMMAGILTKITHPTGGSTVLDYESNTYQLSRTEMISYGLGWVSVRGQGKRPIVTDSVTFKNASPITGASPVAKIVINFSPFSPDALDVAQRVTFKDVTTGASIITWTSDLFSANGGYEQPHTIEYLYTCDTSHTYRIIASVNDENSTSVTVDISSTKRNTSISTNLGGGIRVSTISSYNADNSLQKREKYAYGINENGMGIMPISGTEVIYNNFQAMGTRTIIGDPIGCRAVPGYRYTYTASNVYPTLSLQGAQVLYPSVTKYDLAVDGKPNGKTLLQYELPADYISIPSPGSMGGKELIDNSMSDVRLQSEHIYKYNSSGDYTLQKRTINSYIPLETVFIPAVTYWHNYEYTTPDRCGSVNKDEFGYFIFRIKSGGLRLGTTEETLFDDNGNTLQNTITYQYNRYGYPKSVKSTNSKNDTLSTVALFPGDHIASLTDAGVLNRMVRRNMVRQPYWQGSYSKNALLKYGRTLFSDQWSVNDSLIMPKADSTWSLGGAQPELAVAYQGYDKYGNILQLTERNGITSSYSWDANSTYPVTQTIGAANTSVLYDGFEDAGSWAGVVRDNGQARTGRYAGLITNAGTYVSPRWTNVSLAAATKFKYSGWVYSGGPGATVNLLMKRSGEAGAYSYIDNISISQSGKWIYVEKEYSVPADVKSMSIRIDNNGTGKVWFDDIKLRPSSSQMNSFTYQPLIGLTSKSDDQNHILKYEYDGLGRLKVIRDQDGNVLKQIDYQYQAPLTK